MACNQYLRLTLEETAGTYDDGGDVTWIRIHDPSQVTIRRTNRQHIAMSADRCNRPTWLASSRYEVTGGFSTHLYYPQAEFLFDWAMGTSGSPATLPTVTIDHFNGYDYQRFLGCKVGSFAITSNTETDAGAQMLAINCVGMAHEVIDNTDLPAPTLSDFPGNAVLPFFHHQTGTKCKLTTASPGSALVNYKSFVVTVENILTPVFNELLYASSVVYGGRTATLQAVVQQLNATMKAAYHAGTPMNVEIGTHIATLKNWKIDFQLANKFTDVTTESPLDGPNYETLNLTCIFDETAEAGAGADITYTVNVA